MKTAVRRQRTANRTKQGSARLAADRSVLEVFGDVAVLDRACRW